MYILITPAKNEEEIIAQTIESIIITLLYSLNLVTRSRGEPTNSKVVISFSCFRT